MEKRFDVIGIENLIMDFAVQIDKLPKTDGGARILDFCWQSGGNASSAVVALARLGAKCGMVGGIGSDPFGAFCKRDMDYHGVDTSHIKQVEGNTTFCLCLAEQATQGRSILGRGGDVGQLTEEELDERYIAQARAIHMALPFADMARKASELARRNGVLVSIDAGGPVKNFVEMAKSVDILIMSEMCYRALFDDERYEENCKSVLQYGPKVVIVTLGSKGCAGADENGTFYLESFASCDYEIVDSTGAGDVYHGGFVYAYLNRYHQAPYNYDVKDCARFASTVSYINCMTLGGRTGIPTLDMVDTFLETRTVDLSVLDERKRHYKNVNIG